MCRISLTHFASGQTKLTSLSHSRRQWSFQFPFAIHAWKKFPLGKSRLSKVLHRIPGWKKPHLLLDSFIHAYIAYTCIHIFWQNRMSRLFTLQEVSSYIYIYVLYMHCIFRWIFKKNILFKLCKKINTKFLWKDSPNSKHSQAPFEVRLAALVVITRPQFQTDLPRRGAKWFCVLAQFFFKSFP